MSYILKLAGWYPSRVDPLAGDFVQRHARAISLYKKVIVLFLVKDPSLAPGVVEVDIQRSGNGSLIEYIVYYAARGRFEKGLSLLRYLSLGSRMIRRIKKEYGIPELVHVNIVWKAGLLALFLRRRYGWKYVITENWTGYSQLDPCGLHTQSILRRVIYKRVYRNASLFLPVSGELEQQVNRLFPGIPFEIVNNVVDTSIFYYQPLPATSLKMIHVSTMNYQKNIEGILRVLEKLTATREEVELTLVGPYTPGIRQFLLDKGLLDKKVFLTGVISYPEVALLVRQSHGLFLFSRYENQPCVVLEALCCGLPVITTNVGGLPEIIHAGNGILVDPGEEEQLLDAFNFFIDRYADYDREKIAAGAAEKFSYAVIGRQFAEIYRRWAK